MTREIIQVKIKIKLKRSKKNQTAQSSLNCRVPSRKKLVVQGIHLVQSSYQDSWRHHPNVWCYFPPRKEKGIDYVVITNETITDPYQIATRFKFMFCLGVR